MVATRALTTPNPTPNPHAPFRGRKAEKMDKKVKVDVYLTDLDKAVLTHAGYSFEETPGGTLLPLGAVEEFRAVADYGCATGTCPSVLYFADTWEFFRDNRAELVAQLIEQAREGLFGEGVTGAVQAVMNFVCFRRKRAESGFEDSIAQTLFAPLPEKYTDAPSDCVLVANAITWGAFEDLAFRLDGCEVAE